MLLAEINSGFFASKNWAWLCATGELWLISCWRFDKKTAGWAVIFGPLSSSPLENERKNYTSIDPNSMDRYEPFPQFVKPIQIIQVSTFISIDVQRQDRHINI